MSPDPATAFDDLTPYSAAVAVVDFLGLPAEILVPAVRRLRGDRGVPLGAGLVNLGNGLLALVAVRFFRHRPGLWHESTSRLPRWAGPAVIGYLALAPAAAWQRGVVLRRRSALWGTGIHPVGLLQITLLLVGLARARRPSPRSGAAS